jgi:hypothetical protein
MVVRMKSPVLFASFLCVSLSTAQAQVVSKYHITAEEQAACQVDATTLCSSVFPDEDALIACMRSNVTNLSPVCRKTFVAGLQKRHM